MIGYIIIAIALVLIIWFILTSNGLIAKRNRVKQCESGICVALKQRNDLIPNLISTLKAYMKYEDETLTKITELRTKAIQATTEQEQIKTGNELSAMLPKIQATAENYPELKANDQFMKLQDNLNEMEWQIQAIRRTYNAAVTDYNNAIEMFPSSFVASYKKHTCLPLIEIPEIEQRNINVSELLS